MDYELNPLELTPEQARLLRQLLTSSRKNIHAWPADQRYVLGKDTIKLTYSIIKRQESNEVYYECISNQEMHKTSTGAFYDILGTFQLKGGFKFIQCQPRIVKHYDWDEPEHSEYKSVREFKASPPHLEAIPPIAGVSDKSSLLEEEVTLPKTDVYIIMRKQPGEPLLEILNQDFQSRDQSGDIPFFNLEKRQALTLALLRTYKTQVIDSDLEYHGSIKPENIMVDLSTNPPTVNFINYANARQVTDMSKPVNYYTTPAYASPEQLFKIPLDSKTDIYSLGRILYLLWGWPNDTYDSHNIEKIKSQASKVNLELLFQNIEGLTPSQKEDIKETLEAMLNGIPERRPTITEIEASFSAYAKPIKMIDPLDPSLSLEDQKMLYDYLSSNPSQAFWEKGSKIGSNEASQYRLAFNVQKRLREHQDTAFRYEVLSEKPFRTGQKGVFLFDSRGTFHLETPGKVTVKPIKPDKTRRIKWRSGDIPKQSQAQAEYSRSPPFLHMKKPTYGFFNGKPISLLTGRKVPGSDLCDFIAKDFANLEAPNRLSLYQRLNLIIKILEAVKTQVVEHGIIHYDLKPENIIVRNLPTDPVVTIIDYESSCKIGDTLSESGGKTLAYAAPEVLSKTIILTEKSDIFSLGRILYPLLGGTDESYDVDISKTDEQMLSITGKIDNLFRYFPKSERQQLTPEIEQTIANTLEGMLNPDPNQRTSLDEAIVQFKMIRDTNGLCAEEDAPFRPS